MKISFQFVALAISAWSLAGVPGQTQGVDVSARIELRQPDAPHHAGMKNADGSNAVVLWLSPVRGTVSRLPAVRQGAYKLVQKNKQFTPHLLVVPTGSSVEFPNLDPFYHNVFSLFNGKRFDLGLYEAGSSRDVRFDREGVSYIFCNIHPGMGAVVLSLSTPYYAIAAAGGVVTIHDVPAGSYRLSLWSEVGQPASLSAASRIVQVGQTEVKLGLIEIQGAATHPMDQHKNKFGESYPPDVSPLY